MARRKKREGQSLHKVLGVPALFSTAYGNVGSSIYYALGVVAASAMGLTPVVFMLTGLLFVTTAFSYAEATTMFPEAGGSSSFARHTFNEFVSFGAGWALMLDYIITIAISAFFVPNYLAAFWPMLKIWPYNSIGGILVIVFLVTINIVGIKEAARVNIILAILDLGTQVLLAIVGVFVFVSPKILINQIHVGVAPTWHQLIYGISIGTVAYTGIETVSNMAEESSDPGRDVPKAVKYVLLAVLGVYFAISMVGLSAMTVNYNVLPVDPQTGIIKPVDVIPAPGKRAETGPYVLKSNPKQDVYVRVDPDVLQISPTSDITFQVKATGPAYQQNGQWVTKVWGTQLGNVYEADPLQGIVQNLPDNLDWMKTILTPWIAILAATILLIGANAGIIGSSRLAYSMASHKQLPPILGRVHPKRYTPYVAIALFGLIASVLVAPGKVALLADLYAFGAMISFTVAHICVITLRFQQPDFERPWRTPINIPFRGKSIPVLAVLGGLGTATVWVVVVLTHFWGRWIGLSWMLVGIVMYIVYRKAKGYSLTKTVEKVVVPAEHAGRHRLQPDPRAHHRHLDQRRDDGPRLPARDREAVVHRRHLRHRGAAQPAARRAPRQRARAGREGAQGGRGHRRPVQRQVHPARGHLAAGRARHLRDGDRAAQRGHHAGDHAQAAHRQPRVREDHRLRARPRALRGPAQPRSQGLSFRGVRRRRAGRAARADASRRERRAGRPRREQLRSVPCMS